MSTDHQKNSWLHPSWRSVKSFARRGSRTPIPEDSVLSLESLFTRRLSKSSNSEDSRSIRSNTSRGRGLIRAINRIRSSSSLSTGSRSKDLRIEDFEDIQDWIKGFAKYNQFVTNQISEDDSKKVNAICTSLTSQCQGDFFHGLPEAMFDLALLWCPSTELHRKPVDTEPSWSWAGWKTEAGRPAVNFPFDFTSCPDARSLDCEVIFKSEIPSFYLGPLDASWSQLYELRRTRERVRTGFPKIWIPSDRKPSETDTLHFEARTIAAKGFSIVQLTDEMDNKLPVCQLLDDNNKQCGVIMDYGDLLSVPVDVPGPIHESSPGSFDFVLLSRNRRCEGKPTSRRSGSNVAHPPGTPIWNGKSFDWNQELEDFEAPYEDGDWKMLNVMLVQHLDEEEPGKGWAERVAIARIHEDAWNARRDPKFPKKHIKLR